MPNLILDCLNAHADIKPLTSFAIYKLIKKAIQQAELPLVKVLVEDTGLDFSQGQFRYLLHQMVVAQATKERDKFLEQGEEMSTFDSPSSQAK